MKLARSLPEFRRFLCLALLAALAVRAGMAAQEPPEIPPEFRDNQRTVTILADSQKKDKQIFSLKGHVVISLRDWMLTADEASYDDSTGDVVAKGHVVFDDPRAHLEADEAHYNIHTTQGWFLQGHGYVHPVLHQRARVLATENPFYLSGRRVDRLTPSTYYIAHGRVTTCDCEKTGWTISAHDARIESGDKAVSHGAMFRFLRVPLF